MIVCTVPYQTASHHHSFVIVTMAPLRASLKCSRCWLVLLCWTLSFGSRSSSKSLVVSAQQKESLDHHHQQQQQQKHQPPESPSKEEPTCDTPESSASSSCSVFYHSPTEWLHAGADVARGETAVPFQDVVIHFTQHDRRAWPLWLRHDIFYQIPQKPYEFIFAPAIHGILHKDHRAANLLSVDATLEELAHKTTADTPDTPPVLNPPIRAAVPIRVGDPLFYPTHNDEQLSSHADVRMVPDDIAQQITLAAEKGQQEAEDDLNDETECILSSHLHHGPSTIPGVTYGLFTTKPIAAGDILATDAVLHMHRSELYNATGDYHEPLLNYCYGHPASDLLLLPHGPQVYHLNHHATKHNVAVQWFESAEEVNQVFDLATNMAAFHETEHPVLHFVYVATRDIAAGDELFLNYGHDFEQARQVHRRKQRSQQEQSTPFRHEIGLSIFPQQWLKTQVRGEPFPAWNTDKLSPGQIQKAQLENGRVISNYTYRVGLPEGLADHMEQWADDMGISAIMEEWLQPGRMMKEGSEARIRINGGMWWFRRFEKDWQSDLFYITPDDDEANEQFIHTLADAGFDRVMQAIGEEHRLQYLTAFYPSFIAMTHSQSSFMHSDSDDR